MTFAWDEVKDRVNRRKHRVSFETAMRVFDDRFAFSYVDAIIDSEVRWHTIGLVDGISILLVVHTCEDEHGEEEIRIISARKADPSERIVYYANH